MPHAGNKLKKEFAQVSPENFPGWEIIKRGLNDIRQGKYQSIEALAVFTASPRLNRLGFRVSEERFAFPHLLLYKKLKKAYPADAYSQYNALMRRMAKFCNHYES